MSETQANEKPRIWSALRLNGREMRGDAFAQGIIVGSLRR
jgi:hypothetical protein